MDPRRGGRTAAAAASWASASFPIRRWGTVFSPAKSVPPQIFRRRPAQDQSALRRENFQRNLRIVDEVQAVAAEAGATPAQIALVWLLAPGDDIAPIPGTKRVARAEENTAADGVVLSTDQVERLNNLTPASGERHDEGNMAAVDR